MKICIICIASQGVKHKSYSNLQLLLISKHYWKDLSIDFVTGLSVSSNGKSKIYHSILVIADWPTKIVCYKPVKVIVDALGLVEVIIEVVINHHNLPNSIVVDCDSIFTSKIWLSLCYSLKTKESYQSLCITDRQLDWIWKPHNRSLYPGFCYVFIK